MEQFKKLKEYLSHFAKYEGESVSTDEDLKQTLNHFLEYWFWDGIGTMASNEAPRSKSMSEEECFNYLCEQHEKVVREIIRKHSDLTSKKLIDDPYKFSKKHIIKMAHGDNVKFLPLSTEERQWLIAELKKPKPKTKAEQEAAIDEMLGITAKKAAQADKQKPKSR